MKHNDDVSLYETFLITDDLLWKISRNTDLLYLQKELDKEITVLYDVCLTVKLRYIIFFEKNFVDYFLFFVIHIVTPC